MAIKIPSKHIYSMDNPKIRDNFIDNVKVSTTIIQPDNGFETPVYNDTVKIENELSKSFQGEQNLEMGNFAVYRPTVCCGVKNYEYKYFTFDLHFSRLSNNHYITKIFSGLKKDSNTNYIGINKQVTQEIFEFEVANGLLFKGNYINEFDYTYSFDTEKILSNSQNKVKIGETQYNDIQGNKTTFYINDTNQYPVEGSVLNKLFFNNLEKSEKNENISTVSTVIGGMALWEIPNFEATENIPNQEYDSLLSPQIVENEDYFIIKNITLPVGIKTIHYASAFYRPLGDGDYTINDYFTKYYPVKVIETNQVAHKIEITIYGNTIGISLEDGTITYGSGTKPFSLDGNELLQDSATTNGKLTTQHLAENILAQYKNGKETATLLCDIGEYYEENETKVIGIEMQDRMSFHEHDLVIPYVFGADGKDRPMSKYSNGEPKVFEVVSVKRFFDGAVWQELSLLEFTKTT